MSNPGLFAALRRIGQALVVAGAVVVAIGVIGSLTGDGDGPTAESATTTTTSQPATTTTAPVTTTTTSAATTTTTTATTTSSTTTAPVTTTTLPGPQAVEEFVADFAAATAAGDADFLFDRLHPVVISLSDEATCRAYVEREIVEIDDYRLTGPVQRTTRTVDVGGRSVLIDPLFTAPVTFQFEGQEVQTEGQFAPVDGEMRWLTQCR